MSGALSGTVTTQSVASGVIRKLVGRTPFAAVMLAVVALLMSFGDGRSAIATEDECTVQPRRTAELAVVARAPEGIARSLAGEAPVATPEPPPLGQAADPEVAASVAAAARELVACYNAGDLRRIFALYSEEYLYTVWGGFAGSNPDQAQIDQAIAFMSTPVPQPVESAVDLIAVEDVRILPDGRISAIVRLSSGSQLAVFRYSDGWYQLIWSYPLP